MKETVCKLEKKKKKEKNLAKYKAGGVGTAS